MTLFSAIGLLTSLRLKGELEECLAKIKAMSAQANISEFVALELKGKLSRYPKFRWIFPDLLRHDDRRLCRTYRVPPGHRESDMIVGRSSEIAPWHFISIAAGLTITTKSRSRWPSPLSPEDGSMDAIFVHLCFSQAAHDEKAWSVRLHLPLQLFVVVVARASRSRAAT